ncbi:MAG: hypothetical protein ACW991_05955 [Candidatus Hodarchaeales archaeon]|jgi:hypothetical protein
MNKSRIIIITLFGSLFISNFRSQIYATHKEPDIHSNISTTTQIEPVNISLNKRIIRSTEKIQLKIEITNFCDMTTDFIYKIWGEKFYFSNRDGSTLYQNVTDKIFLNPDQIGNISVNIWYDPETEDLLSSVQVFSVEIIKADTTEMIYSKTEWVWIYSEYNEMVKPKIPDIRYPLYNDQSLLVSYSLHYNENTSSGFIRFNINNLADNTQEYRITISNGSQFLRFDESYIDGGYECSLICSGKGNYEANFNYLLPEGSVWALIPITIVFQLDSEKLLEKEVVIEIQPINQSRNNIAKKSGDFLIKENGTVLITSSKDLSRI